MQRFAQNWLLTKWQTNPLITCSCIVQGPGVTQETGSGAEVVAAGPAAKARDPVGHAAHPVAEALFHPGPDNTLCTTYIADAPQPLLDADQHATTPDAPAGAC